MNNLKKAYIVLAILSLFCMGLYAQTTITLNPASGTGISTTTTVTPTLTWAHTDGNGAMLFNGQYQVLIATNAQMDNPISITIPRVGANAPQNVTLGVAPAVGVFLQYDTTYYWQVRQFYPTVVSNNEMENPSDIGTFRTPKMSVAPMLSWAPIASPLQNYEIQITGGGETFNLATGSQDNYYQMIAATDGLLKYNTTYTWRVRRATGAWVTQTPFTTKELRIFSEVYTAPPIVDPLYQNQLLNPTPDPLPTNLTFTAVTDEFENFDTLKMNARYWATSTVSDPNRAPLKPTYEAPINGRSTITKVLDVKQFTGSSAVSPADDGYIYLSDGETITLLFEYGNAITLLTDNLGASIVVDYLKIYTNVSEVVDSVAAPPDTFLVYDTELVNDFYNQQFYIALEFDQGATPPPDPLTFGLSKKIIIQAMESGKEIVKYAISEHYETTDPTLTIDDIYKLPVTVAEINSSFYGNGAGMISPQRPIRLHIYLADDPSKSRDIIWTGYNNSSLPIASSVTFGAATYDLTDTPQITGNGWVRLISSVDPVGIIVNSAQMSEFYMGPESEYPATLAAGYPNGAYVMAVPFNYPTGTMLASFNLTPQAYTPFQMVTPTDFTTNVDVYTRFSWTQGFTPERAPDDMTHYRVRIWTAAAYTAGGGFINNLPDFTYTTTNTFLYPEVDLDFGGEVYYWRVDIVPTATNSAPTNVNGLASQYAWTFTTCQQTGYTVTEPIGGNRTLTEGGNYIFGDGAVVEAGATLTIPKGVTIEFQQDAQLVVEGNLDIQGTDTEPVTFKKVPDATSWGGIVFTADSQDPLVVDDAYNYVSGPHIDGLILTDATNPISYADGVQYDIYIENSEFTNNDNGIKVSDGSYLKNITISDFNSPGTADLAAVDGGYYINTVTIDGTVGDEKFLGSGIKTTSPDAIITENTVSNVAGNGIAVNAGAGNALIHLNTITGTGTSNLSVAINANQGATVTANLIGNHDKSDIALRNTGYGIQGGSLIADNTIIQNGNGAIQADTGATVLNNYIEDNKGFGIRFGNNIVANQIINTPATQGTDLEGYRSINAITADADAYVASNIIQNSDGYGINGGAHIFNNTISLPPNVNNITPPFANPAVDTHYAINASVGALVENNTISNPIGYGINNGAEITGNTIISTPNPTSPTLPGAYGIKADVGALVANNDIRHMRGTAIENGMEIRDNYINNPITGILSDPAAVIINNELIGGTLSTGFAIHNGTIINNNKVSGFRTGFTRALYDIVWSDQVTEFRNNDIRSNEAHNGSVVNAEKPANITTSLAFTGNKILNNTYTQNHVRVASTFLTFTDNEINNMSSGYTDGLIDPTIPVAMGEGTGVYLKLVDNNAIVQRNLIVGHLGAVNGAGLFIDATNPAFIVVIDDQNVISGNEALQPGSKGAGVYVQTGTVYLGSLAMTVPPPPPATAVLGNTITNNKIDPQGVTEFVPEDEIATLIADGFVPAGAGIHIAGGTVYLYRNIVAANRGNYGIYGAPVVMTPSAMTANNIYDNYIVEPERDGMVARQDKVNQNFYYTAPANLSAISNFWGTRSDRGQIHPSIYDRVYLNTLGMVTYQPILAGPSEQTPGIVDNIAGVRVLDDMPYTVHNPNYVWGSGLIGYVISYSPDDTTAVDFREYLVVVNARDNNDYSADFTEVIIQNTSTGQFIRPLLWETGLDHEVYVARFQFTDGVYDSDKNWLPASGGDVIRIFSVKSPSVAVTGIIGEDGDTYITPYVKSYNFGRWVAGAGYAYHYEVPTSGQPAVLDDIYDPTALDVGASVDYRYNTMIYPFKVFTFTNAGSSEEFRVKDIRIDITDTSLQNGNATAFEIVSVQPNTTSNIPAFTTGDPESNWTIVPPGASFDVVVVFKATGATGPAGDPNGAIVDADLVVEVQVGPGASATADTKHNRKIRLEGYIIDAWTTLEEYIDGVQVYEDWFGDPVILTNQMTVVSHVTINGINADMHDVVGAYTIKNMKEELRGKYIVQQTGGLNTIVVNFDRADEEIFFKVWDHTRHVLYETPPSVNVKSVTNGTINLKEITALARYHVTGRITDSRTPNPGLPTILLKNMHKEAEVNSPFAHTTDKDGYFFKSMWFGEKLIILPQKKAWTFKANETALTDDWDTSVNTGSLPDPREIEMNTQEFQIASTAGDLTISTNGAFLNYRFEDVDDDASYVLANTLSAINPNTNHNLDETGLELYTLGSAPNQITLFKLSDNHKGLDFVGTIEQVVLAGKISVHAPAILGDYSEIPLANLEFTLNIQGATPLLITTDANGQYYLLVDSESVIQNITITQDQIDAAGYSHVVPDHVAYTPDLVYTYQNAGDYTITTPTYDFDIQLDTNYERTQVIDLKPGWNLISFNVELDPNDIESVFGPSGADLLPFLKEIRTLEDVATVDMQDPGTPPLIPFISPVSTLTNLVPGQGYYVLMGDDETDPLTAIVPFTAQSLTVTGRPAKVTDISLLSNNWNLVGYTPGRVAQTRAVVKNNEDILQIDDTFEAYFYDDVPVGASTLRFMEPGTGYWVHAAATGAPAISYNSPIYNNVVKSFRLAAEDPDDGTLPATMTPSGSHSYAIIDNDYAGFVRNDDLLDDPDDLIPGEPYKIIDATGASFAASTGIRGLVGEVFIAPNDPATDITGLTGDGFRPFKGPKQMRITVPAGHTLSDTPDVLFDIANTFDPADGLGKIYTRTEYLALVDLLYTDGLNPGGIIPGGWDNFLSGVLATGTLYDAFEYSTIVFDDDYYLIFASQALAPDPVDDRKHTQVVVYHLIVDEADADDAGLVTVWLADNNTIFKAIQTGADMFTIAIPDNFTFTAPMLEFAATGVRVYTTDPTPADPAPAGFAISGQEPLPSQTSFSLWVVEEDTPDKAEYKVNIVRVPNASFELPNRAYRHFAGTSRPVTPPSITRWNDPFGVPSYKTNNQLFMLQINNNGAQVSNDNVVAAFVGNELRGKVKIKSWNGRSYAPILVSTVIPNETVTFKIWNQNMGIKTWVDPTFSTIPGGTTGTVSNPIALNITLDDSDVVTPMYVNQLNAAYPNPFNPSTNISFSLKADQHANISIYNIKGQRVNTLVNEVLPAGHHRVVWNGDNSDGRQIGSGIYFIRMQTPGYTKVEKAVLIK